MKKLLLSIMALAAIHFAEAKKVKFQVDMTAQTVHANGVHVAGDFQSEAGSADWTVDGTPMSNGGSGNIYSVIVDIPAQAYYEFKFINDNDWPGGENVPALNQVGGGNLNRWVYIDSVANDTTVLPAVLFGGEAPSGKFAVRFKLDMRNEVVEAKGVHIAGDFQGWNPAANTLFNVISSTSVYEYIAYLDAGSYEYKYINGNDWNNAPSVSENVPAGCANGGGNRILTVSADAALSLVCFGKCDACVQPFIVSKDVTFTIKDANHTLQNVKIKGSFSGWATFDAVDDGTNGDETANDHTWTATYLISGDTSNVYEWGAEAKDTALGTEGWIIKGLNRTLRLNGEVVGTDTVVTIDASSDTSYTTEVRGALINVTFSVDMSNEVPNPSGVYIAGDFQFPANWDKDTLQLTQAGTLFSRTVAVYAGDYEFKFYNGKFTSSGNEDEFAETAGFDTLGCGTKKPGFGANRTLTLTGLTHDTVLATFIYNSCQTSSVGITEQVLNTTNFKLYPNPAENYVSVEFNDHAASHTIHIVDITGRVIASYNDQKQNTLISLDGIKAGIYFIKASNTRNESVTSKLIVR